MKQEYSVYLMLMLLASLLPLASPLTAQVSHGGQPLALSFLRSSDELLYKEMPAFDVQEEMCIDSLNESDLRGGYRFAYKFITDYEPTNSGTTFTMADGTCVWRLGIYSPGAYSINVLFTEYELPEGAQLFLYNEDQSQILGAFNHLNNSELQILPVAPIQGERLIIEYQEPANASFNGKLRVGEVNHAYRDFRGIEPKDDMSTISGIPALACYQDGTNDYSLWGQSVVLLIIDGITGCTGVLLNNTDNDGTPYLLTASHCLNDQFQITNPDYEEVAGSIVCFFNYNSPFCDPITRGTEEMSTASCYFRAVNEQADMALLELTEVPPAYYRPYYAGWNVQEAGAFPYACLQHPNYSVKRISLAEDDLSLTTFIISSMDFYEEAHWLVKHWDTGYTASGSSGAPLFNADGEVIGGLSGGQSTSSSPNTDYFFSLMAAWDANDTIDKQLKQWLNPADDNTLSSQGLDPYQSTPCYRLSNIYDSGNQENAECTLYPDSETAPLFGNNDSGITEYAEAYHISEEATLYGAYFVTPAAGSNYAEMEVEVTVYRGESQPTTLLYTETFQPVYCNKSSQGDSFTETAKSLNRAQESFITFSKPVDVSGNFYVGYTLKSMPDDTYFAAYNLPQGQTANNTAWVHNQGEWIQANQYAQAGFSTSLFIDPVIQYGHLVQNEPIETVKDVRVYLGSERGTIHIILPDGVKKANYLLHTAQGKPVGRGSVTDKQTTLQLTNRASGIYFLTITYAETRVTRKIIL